MTGYVALSGGSGKRPPLGRIKEQGYLWPMTRVRISIVLTIMLLPLILSAGPAAAEAVGNFGDWTAFVDGKGKGKVCYVASIPKKETGKYKSRGAAYILITHRPGEKKRDVVELRAGYTYKTDSEVSLAIDDGRFKLFTDGGTAWAKDAALDSRLAKAMIKGKTMVVKGTSSRDTATTDTYSLIGLTAAYRTISKACGVK